MRPGEGVIARRAPVGRGRNSTSATAGRVLSAATTGAHRVGAFARGSRRARRSQRHSRRELWQGWGQIRVAGRGRPRASRRGARASSRARVSRAVPMRARDARDEGISSSRARRASSPRERERDDAPFARRPREPLARQPAIRRRRRRDGLAREGTRERDGKFASRVSTRDEAIGHRASGDGDIVVGRSDVAPETCAQKCARGNINGVRTPEYDVGRWFFRRATSASSSRRLSATRRRHIMTGRAAGRVAIRDDVRGDVIVSPGVAISGDSVVRRERARGGGAVEGGR